MKCGSCEKKISRIYWYMCKILPFTVSYSLSTRDEHGEISKAVPLCKPCGKFYSTVEQLINMVGEEKAIQMINGFSDESTE